MLMIDIVRFGCLWCLQWMFRVTMLGMVPMRRHALGCSLLLAFTFVAGAVRCSFAPYFRCCLTHSRTWAVGLVVNSLKESSLPPPVSRLMRE